MKRSIIFHTNHNFLERPKELESGSSLRPKKIYKAFQEAGYDVFLIQGSRRQRIKAALKILFSKKKYLFCYSETSVGPLSPWDILLYFILRIKKIPLGVYYRDFYWRVPEIFPYKGIKRGYLILRHKFDLLILKLFPKVIFFPSQSSALWFNFKRSKILPPGCENRISKNLSFSNTFILIGSASERYGSKIVLEAFKELNESGKQCNLILVCREGEKKYFEDYFKYQKNWLEITTASGDDLKNFYQKSSWGIVMLKKNPYNDKAIPVKLFEYLSYGLPIIASNCFELAEFVEKNKIGLIFDDNKDSFKEVLKKVLNNHKLWKYYQKNVLNILRENLWLKRIKEVEECLLLKNCQ